MPESSAPLQRPVVPPRLAALDGGDETTAIELVASAFDPWRLTLARQRNGLTKTELAARVGVSPAAVSQFESGKARPAVPTLQTLARELGVAAEYFAAGRPSVRLSPEQAHFRSLRSTRVAERHQALATVAHGAEVVRVLERLVRLPNVCVPAAQRGTDPATAARRVREAWDLPAGPVAHLVRLLESNGVVVLMAEFAASQRIDAFSAHVAPLNRPVMCLSADRRNVLRRRFNAAHELGHLVLHADAAPGSAQLEAEANAFAAEFLMPVHDIAPLLPQRVDLAQFVELQRSWGVSIQALLYRARELDVLAETAYRQAWSLLTRLGWRRDEPAEDLAGEWPIMLARALDLAESCGLTMGRLGAGLRLPVSEVGALVGIRRDERPALRIAAAGEPREGDEAYRPAETALLADSD